MSPVHKRGPISEKSEAALRGGFLIDEHSGVFEVGGWKLVPGTGLEPARLAALDPKSSASANSAIPALL